ncbi:hypothetical protein TBK1r_00480 [Stieleria magnilauensis]|uniref:Secreted protein n=1 Tax=Stieleria magnilauensis TaxID=2527963 RepID=A0ABX5XGK8_9BACT|nr:hypothetical protein TBK1r_00480 [Planctomycetes bacterium TBK1r]
MKMLSHQIAMSLGFAALIGSFWIVLAKHPEDSLARTYHLAACDGQAFDDATGECESQPQCQLATPCAAHSEQNCSSTPGYYKVTGNWYKCGDAGGAGEGCMQSEQSKCRQDYVCTWIQYAGCQATSTDAGSACGNQCYTVVIP